MIQKRWWLLIILFSSINLIRAEGDDKANLTLVQVVNITDKMPVENISALFFSKGKMFFRDESDMEGYLLAPQITDFFFKSSSLITFTTYCELNLFSLNNPGDEIVTTSN